MRGTWSIVVSPPGPRGRVRSIVLSLPVLLALAVVAALGLGGLCRIAWVGARYVSARVGVAQEQRNNEVLLAKVRFLGKLAQQESRQLESLAAFEDAVRLKYGMNVIAEQLRRAGVGGRPEAEVLVAQLLRGPVVASADSVKDDIAGLLRRAQLQDSTLEEVLQQYGREHEQLADRPSVWPVHGRITSGFGARLHPFTGVVGPHEGIDIANQEWTPVLATADGIVSFSGVLQYYGNIVIVDHHGSGYSTRFAHMVQPAVVEGQVVRRGDLLGYMGHSGRSTGTHLHYEIRVMNRPVNPIDYIVPGDILVD